MFFDSNHAIYINLIPVTGFLCPLVCQFDQISLFSAYQNWKPPTFEMFWSSLNGGPFTPWKPVACHKCHNQEKKHSENEHARCQVHVGKICFTSVYIFQSSEPPRHYWPPPKLAPWPMLNKILLNMIWKFFYTLLKFPSAKSVSGKSGNIGGKSEKLSTLPRDLRFVAISHLRRPKSINKSIEHGDFQQCHPTSSFKALCSR